MVESCWLWIVRIFNIVSLHFGERGRTNLLLCCFIGSLSSGPGLTSNEQMTTLTHCYFDWALLSVT
jgi:hypothetical protein